MSNRPTRDHKRILVLIVFRMGMTRPDRHILELCEAFKHLLGLTGENSVFVGQGNVWKGNLGITVQRPLGWILLISG